MKYWPLLISSLACMRETPPSSPPWGVRSTSGYTLLTGSSRPISTSLLPARSKLAAPGSIVSRGLAAVAALGVCGIAAGAGAPAGAAVRLTPQLVQNASPARFTVPQAGHVTDPAPADGDAPA